MSEALKSGLELLAMAAVLGGFFALNFRLGSAAIWGGISADRRKNPFGFWLVQIALGAIGLMALLAAISVLLGITPP